MKKSEITSLTVLNATGRFGIRIMVAIAQSSCIGGTTPDSTRTLAGRPSTWTLWWFGERNGVGSKGKDAMFVSVEVAEVIDEVWIGLAGWKTAAWRRFLAENKGTE